jgi:hypothetical protein
MDEQPWPEEEEEEEEENMGAGIFMSMMSRERTSLHEM